MLWVHFERGRENDLELSEMWKTVCDGGANADALYAVRPYLPRCALGLFPHPLLSFSHGKDLILAFFNIWTFFRKRKSSKETRVRIEIKVNSISIFDYEFSDR